MIYEYWLAGIKEITDLKKQKLREVYGSGKAIYYIEETQMHRQIIYHIYLLWNNLPVFYYAGCCPDCHRARGYFYTATLRSGE